MRKIFLCAWGLAAALAPTSGFASSTSQLSFSCGDFAAAIADHTKRDDMQWAGPIDHAPTGKSNKVLIIGAGQKFYVPRYTQPSQGLAPKTVMQNLTEYNDTYDEAYWRCVNATNITINLKR